MAEAGFYWCGTETEPDIATCFLCNKVLDGWEAEDNPWTEHKSHAPQCEFVILGRPEGLLTVSRYSHQAYLFVISIKINLACLETIVIIFV